jgi:hypothetical protein
MSHAWKAFLMGAAIVGIGKVLAHYQAATPIPFWLLSPGILAGACVPDSGFNPEGDYRPWGPISTTVVYAVDILLYTLISRLGLAVWNARKPAHPSH